MARIPPVRNGDLGREHAMLDYTRMLQSGYYPDKALDAVEYRVLG